MNNEHLDALQLRLQQAAKVLAASRPKRPLSAFDLFAHSLKQ
jgi:hypothetical protein